MLQGNTSAIRNHAARHEDGGGDQVNVAGLSGLLDDAQTPLAHTQLEATITDLDKYTQGEVDGLFTTHTAIASAHHVKYTDAEAVTAAKTVKLDDFATPEDNTDLDFGTTRHGLVPKGTGIGDFLRDDGTWAAVAGGGGDVVGPAGATDNAVARYDLTTGKLLQDSVVIITNAGAVSGVTSLSASGAVTGSNLNVGNWDTAYGWGDHAGLYDPINTSSTHAALTTGTHGVGDSTIASVLDIANHAALDTGVHGAGGDVLATDADIATAVADYLPLAGGTMAGDIDMGDNDITGLREILPFDLELNIAFASASDATVYIKNTGGAGSFGVPDVDLKIDTLVAYWKMEETGASDRVDSKGGNDLTASNAPGTRSGIIDNAVDLDGTNQYLSRADTADLSPTVGFAISMWVNPDSNATNEGFWSKGEDHYFWRGTGTGGLFMRITQSDTTTKNFTADVNDDLLGGFHHVVMMACDGFLRLFINGVEKDPAVAYDNTLIDNADDFFIGQLGHPAHPVDGGMDEVSFWKDISFSSQAQREAWVEGLYGTGTPPAYTPAGTGAANFDIQDDLAVGGDAVIAGTLDMSDQLIHGVADPVNLDDAVNLDTLLDHIGVSLKYYLGNQTLDLTITDAEATLTETPNADPDELTTITFKSSVADTPAPFTIVFGTQIEVHFSADESSGGGRSEGLHCQFGYVDANGTSNFVQIGEDSDVTAEITDVKTAYAVHIHVTSDITVPAGKRLWLKFIATTLSGGGGYPTLRVYYDESAHHMNILVAGGVLGSFIKAGTYSFGLPPGAASHQADGSDNNCDSYFAEYDSTDKEEYVNVESLDTDQDLDIVYQLQVPWDFASWDTDNAINITYKVDDGANAGATVYVYDTAGDLDYTSSRGQSTSVADITITAANVDGTYTPGSTFIVIVKADGDADDNIYVGKILAKYNRA